MSTPLRRTRERLAKKKSQVGPKIAGVLRKLGREFVAGMQRERMSGPTSAQSLSVRTGALRRSLKHEVTAEKERATLTVFFVKGVPYARIHETGGVIRAKRAKYLTIPLKGALTAAGVSRGGARSGAYAETFIAKSRAGNLMIFGKLATRSKMKAGKLRGTDLITTGSRGSVVPLFVLKRSVKIPARLGLRKTWRKFLPKAQNEIRAALKGMV